MSLIEGFKKIDNNLWGEAFKASPKIYKSPEGRFVGAFALTEGVDTILPKNPLDTILVEGKKIKEWKIVMVSTSKDKVVKGEEFYRLMDFLKEYVIDEDEEYYLIKGLTLDEMERVDNR